MFARIKRIAPRRGWRAFVGEVGIIVLGVLIAVGIGKVVEALDWRDRVALARQTLDEEIAGNGHFNLAERLRVTPCLHRQLDRLEAALLRDTGATRTPVAQYTGRVISGVYVHPIRGWSEREWASAVADAIPSHMTASDRNFYRTHYDVMREMSTLNDDEFRDVADLNLLARPIALDLRTRTDLLRTIMRQRRRVDLLHAYAEFGMENISGSGRRFRITPAQRAEWNTINWCRANGLA